jgi:Cu(I)/Ag(I) efflux system membrane fusion protein/cobalt-zinc-cadmium efflux system membrane fusion protein
MTDAARNYKIAFFFALAVVVALAAWLVLDWRNAHQQTALSANATNATAAPAPSPAAKVTDIPLTPVQLSPERMQSIGVKLGTAEIQRVSDEIRAAGNVEIDERRVAYVQTRFPGWIRTVYADASYQFIRKGQPLFTIYSPDLVTTEQEYLLAKKNVEAVRSSSVSGVASGSQSLLAATRQRLEQWDVPASEIQKLESTGKVITDLTFNSPVTGYITERNALPNMYVQPETKLYTVADLSSVWVSAQIFQSDLGRIKPGDPAVVTVDAYPGQTFNGRIRDILPQVDMTTRTARVRLSLANPGLKLKPGMYVNVVLHVPLGRQLVVPSSAVLHAGLRQLVFVSRGEGVFDPREVQTSGQAGDKTIIIKGLKAGEHIVISASFLIDSESQLQAAAGAFNPPPPAGAGAGTAVSQTAASQAKLELTTQPDPPRKGNNIFRVKLTDDAGSPSLGAQVNVTFFMPAMPAMGMAALKASFDLTDKGGGQYEGAGELGSAGTWQVTLTAQKNGRVIGTRHFTLNAEGGS